MATNRQPRVSRLHLLTARQVQAAADGDHGDGGGLLLRIRGDFASWVMRFTSPTGRRRELGLGGADRSSVAQAGNSLTTARHLAHKARELLRHGTDPIDQRDQHRTLARDAEAARKAERTRQQWTLARAARDYHERVIEPSRTVKHSAQWLASLENHVNPALWHAPIETVDGPALMLALLDVKPHERARRHSGDKVPETVQRIRQRLDAVFEDAIFHERCTTNPAAAVKRKMREANGRRVRGQFKAVSYGDAPALMAQLRSAEGVAARCLELTVLTAARTSETLFAEWSEIDLEAKIWVIAAARMKAGESHTVFLSQRAVDVLKSLRGLHPRWVFPSNMIPDKPMSNMAMLAVLDRLGARDKTTVHGLARATFSTWANETGAARPDVIEAVLAHKEASRVRAAYNRARFNTERRDLLTAWADFLMREPAQVIEFRSAGAVA